MKDQRIGRRCNTLTAIMQKALNWPCRILQGRNRENIFGVPFKRPKYVYFWFSTFFWCISKNAEAHYPRLFSLLWPFECVHCAVCSSHSVFKLLICKSLSFLHSYVLSSIHLFMINIVSIFLALIQRNKLVAMAKASIFVQSYCNVEKEHLFSLLPYYSTKHMSLSNSGLNKYFCKRAQYMWCMQ